MNHHQQQQFQQNMPMNSGLTRYRSAPSSYFTSLLNTNNSSGGGFGADDFDNLFNPRASSPETQRSFSRFINNSGDAIEQNCSSNSQFVPQIKSEIEPQQQLQRQQSNDYSSVSQMVFQSHNSEASNSAMDTHNRVIGSINSNPVEMKTEGGFGGNSTLIRHRSSPAGLFDNINIENEFGATMRGVGSFGAANIANAEAPFSSSSKFNKSQMMPPIPESRSKNIRAKSSIDAEFDEDIPGFPINSWDDDSTILSDSFLKGLTENDDKMFPNANTSDDHDQNVNEGAKRSTTRLSHHLSLPTSSSELSVMEKLLQDSVPCKIRAKRGFATHPRSIAERVRRTKISDRIRKLQELVPNMEKQTNTSDMLDLAVDYIKDLQKQVKTLSDNRAKCSCSAKSKS